MHRLLTVAHVLLFASIANIPEVASQTTCPTGWKDFDGYCWYYSRVVNGADRKESWNAAESFCQSNGGHLAKFDTVEQRDNAYDKIKAFQDTRWWIGLNDLQNEKSFVWIDGTSPSAEVQKWKPGEPSNTNGEDCVEMWVELPLYRGQWNDRSCDKKINFICRKTPGDLPSCEDGWKINAGHGCYKVFTAEQQWHEADLTCRAEGGQLTAITSAGEQAFVTDLILAYTKDFWIGLSDTDNPGQLQWSTHESLSYNNLATGQTTTGLPYQGSTCVEVNMGLGYKWNEVKCANERPFICEKGLKATCPVGWTFLADKCYEFVVNPNRATTWPAAMEYCKVLGASLLKVETGDQQKYLASALESYYNSGAQEIWIGGSDIGHDDIFKWWDKTTINKFYWDVNMPRKHPGRDDCMGMYTGNTGSNNWETSSCFHERQYICELPEGARLPSGPGAITVDGKCDDNWRWFRNKCYFFGPMELAQPRATSECMKYTSKLTSVLDEFEMSFIEGHLTGDAWIGLQITGDTFTWSDGSQYDFQNFAGGEPGSPGEGNCVYARENSALWEDAACDELHLFVCKKDEIPIPEVVITPAPSDPETLKCGGNGWFSDPQSDRCYKVNIEQTRTWNDAQYQCQREAGYLAAIGSQKENDFIAGVTQGLPFVANLWIGASDKMAFQDDVIDVIDGGWSWVDGSPFAFVNWNSGEPNNSGEEDCVELYVENGMWNDLNCVYLRHFVCEKVGNTSSIIGADIAQSECRSNEACCFKHLGVEKGGAIPDSALSASSVRNNNYNETRGRLNMQETILITDIGETHIGYHGAWEPDGDDQETSWFQVDFENHNEIKGIITQGRNGYELNNERQWVTSFKISYSQDPVNTQAAVKDWEFISDSTGAAVIFQGNHDKDTQVTNLFPQPIIARHIRCHPQTYFDRVAMRLEYIGCRASCLHKIGMNSGYISDEMITALSGDAKQARAPVDPAECLDSSNNKGESYRGWIAKTTSGIECQSWVLQSPHAHDNTPQNYPNAGLIGNYCRNPNGGRDRPWCYTTDPKKEWEYCDIPVCPSYTPNGWTSTSSSTSQWVQVQFDTFYKVAGITTYAGPQYYITKYVVQFSDSGVTFTTYKNQAGTDHMFNGPVARNTNYMDILREPITTRFLRIVPKTWFGSIYLQFEINGCYADQRITCADKATQFDGDSLTINCPGGCVEDPNRGIVYGTDTYTESSAICPAAIHAGRLNNQHGGSVELTRTNGINSYLGSYRHGITSESYTTAKHSVIFNGKAYRCPDGWMGWNEHCYYLSPAGVEKSWTEARAACKSIFGDLASIWTMAENDFLTTIIVQSFNGGKIWIGLNALDTGNLYQWSDGSPVTMTKWFLKEPNNANEKCVDIYRANGYWNDMDCTTKYPYICKREKQRLPPSSTIVPPTEDGCELGWKGHEQSCYWTSPDTQPYYYAKQLCEEKGAQLTAISDHYEQSFIHAHVTSSVPPNLGYTSWIGMAAKTEENGAQYYEWETGEEVSFTLWDEGQPYIWLKCHFPFVYKGQTYYECTTVDNPLALYPGAPWCSVTEVFGGALLYCGTGFAQECGYMDDRTGFWQMGLCTSLRYYTCEKPRVGYTKPTLTTFPYWDRPCAEGWVGTETTVECYQINEMTDRSQRVTWQAAYDHCVAQNADLVSIHTFAEEAEIQGYVQNYGTGTYVSFWIGLNSLSNSAGYSWTDGSAVSYTNWGENEPNDHNGKENCVETQMTEGSRWNDVNCDALRNWICKIGKWRTPNPLPTLPPPQGTENSAQCGKDWVGK